jgi:hypothetical protein
MAAAIPPGRFPSSDPRYPFVGPNYQQHGELNGYVYNPWTDKYRPDPKAQQNWGQETGQIEPPPKPPSAMDTLLPIAGGAAAIAGGGIIGKKVIGGLMGGGGGAAAGGATAGTAASGVTSAGTTGSGLMAPEIISAGRVEAAPGAGGMFGSGGALSPTGIGSAGNVILPAAGAYGAYDLFDRNVGPGRGAIQGAASGAAMGSYFGPQGAAIGAGIGLVVGFTKSFFDNPSTRELVEKRWNNLAKSSDPATANYAKQYREYLDSDRAKEDAKLDFQEMKKSGQLKAEDVWGGYGMFKTFGSDWLNKYSEEQRRAISQRLLDENLVDSKKGDIVITDSKRAREIAEEVEQQPSSQGLMQ